MEDSVNRHSVECSGTLPDAVGAGALWIHVKSGGWYEFLMSALDENKGGGSACVVYRSVETGLNWVRPSKEFYDGRFIRARDEQDGQPK